MSPSSGSRHMEAGKIRSIPRPPRLSNLKLIVNTHHHLKKDSMTVMTPLKKLGKELQ